MPEKAADLDGYLFELTWDDTTIRNRLDADPADQKRIDAAMMERNLALREVAQQPRIDSEM